MLQLCSKGCEHAIHVLIQAQKGAPQKNFSIRQICERVSLPEWFTRKVFQRLVRKGILIAQQGPGGGYRFKVPPHKLTLLSIVRAVDGEEILSQCVMGNPSCTVRNPCALHPIWKGARARVIMGLRLTTLQQLVEKRGESSFKQRRKTR